MSSAAVRLFLALDLPDEVRRGLARWAHGTLGERDELRLLPAPDLHVTLCFLGWRAEGEVEALAAIALAQAGPVAELAIGAASWLPPRRPRVLAVDLVDGDGALSALQERLATALAEQAGHRPEKRPYRPHVTLARVRSGARVPGRLRAGLSAPPAAGFAGLALTLYRSHLTRAGARYEALATSAL